MIRYDFDAAYCGVKRPDRGTEPNAAPGVKVHDSGLLLC
jgi:hypothetical protein